MCAHPLQAYSHHRSSTLLHESLYNIGRAAHALGLSGIAHHYYITALASHTAPPTSDEVPLADGQHAQQGGADLSSSAHGRQQQQQQQQQGSEAPGAPDVEMAEAGSQKAGCAGVPAVPAGAAAAYTGGAVGEGYAAAPGPGADEASPALRGHAAGLARGAGAVCRAGEHNQPEGEEGRERGQGRLARAWGTMARKRYTVTAGQGVVEAAGGAGPAAGAAAAAGVGRLLDEAPASLDLTQVWGLCC